MDFFESSLCRRREVCFKCRLDGSYRRGIALSFGLSDDFECPHGITPENLEEKVASAEIKEPPLWDQIGSFTRAMVRSAREAVSGHPVLVDDATRQRRIAICNSCSLFNARGTRCRKCGCRLKIKLRMKTESCPEGKW